MKETRLLMGMPITVEIVDPVALQDDINRVFSYFKSIDERFSTYKEGSEISRINRGEISPDEWSDDMRTVFALSEDTKLSSDGYFDIKKSDGSYDTSGLVKGWAIHHAARMLKDAGCKDFYVDAGGDIEAHGMNAKGHPWTVGIKDPFDQKQIVKVLSIQHEGVATSGTYIRGQHIYDPFTTGRPIVDIVSLTVIGPDIYEADRFATAAFAMGRKGIDFIQRRPDLEGYMIDAEGVATMTTGFEEHTI